MNINKAISRFNELKPNSFSNEEKVRWLSEIDGIIYKNIIANHEGEEEIEYSPYDPFQTNINEKELLAPEAYTNIYFVFMALKADYNNNETSRFNNDAILYNAEFQSLASYWNRTHKPLQKNKIKVGW